MNDLMQILVLLAFLQMAELQPQANTQISKAGLQTFAYTNEKHKKFSKKRGNKDCLENSQQVHKSCFLWFSSSAILLLTFPSSALHAILREYTCSSSPFSACLLAVHLQTILTTVSAHSSKVHLYFQTHLLLLTLKSESFLYLLTSISEIRAFFSLWKFTPLLLWTCHLFSHSRFHILFAPLPRFSHLSGLKTTCTQCDEGKTVLILLFISLAEI